MLITVYAVCIVLVYAFTEDVVINTEETAILGEIIVAEEGNEDQVIEYTVCSATVFVISVYDEGTVVLEITTGKVQLLASNLYRSLSGSRTAE